MITRNIIEQSESLIWVSARTDIGMRRDSNEDSMLVADLAAGTAAMSADMNVYDADERGMLMAISDGMGGAAAGEVASHIAITVLHAVLKQKDDLDLAARLKMAVELANIREGTRAPSPAMCCRRWDRPRGTCRRRSPALPPPDHSMNRPSERASCAA